MGGEKKTTIVESENKTTAFKAFKSRPLGVFLSIKETSLPLKDRLQKINNFTAEYLKKRKISLDEYISSLRQIAIMLNAGLPINICVAEAHNSVNDAVVKNILDQVSQDINSGVSLTNSFARFKREVGNLSVAMIKLGEQTGQIGESISKLADILEEVQDNKKRLKSALRYPIFILSAMIIAFVFVILKVVPQFEAIFKKSGSDLPLPTKMLLVIKDGLVDYGPYMLGILIIGAMVHYYLYTRQYWYKLKFDKHLLKVYIFGNVIQFAMLRRFIYIFDKLSQTGIPIVESVKTSIGIVDNAYINEELKAISQSIEEGRGLHYGFEKVGLFESMILQMIKAGETSGALNAMLEKIADYYRKKYLEIIENVSSLLEPIILIILAVFIVFFALGIFLPMWDMADAMGA
jgi:type II secretory pathway component PulF